MRELSSSAFPLGETSLHLLHTPDGDMFVTADLAVKLFDSAPATFAEFVRANRYVRVNAMERAVVRLCASLGIPPETAGGDKSASVAAATVARVGTTAGDPNENGASANAGTGPTDAVTLLPEKTVLAILRDRRATRRAAQFRETAARRSFVAAERLAKRGEYADALPLALDAVRRGQDIHSTPRARMAAADAASEKASAPARDAADGTSAPHVALFEPYLLAATIALALGKTDACENLVGLASWIALRRGDAVPETRRARLKRLRGELRSRQGRMADALEEFASAAARAAEADGPQTPRVALELFKLADAFRGDCGTSGEDGPGTSGSGSGSGSSPAVRTRETRRGDAPDETRWSEFRDDAARDANVSSFAAGNPGSRTADDQAARARSASRLDAAATNVWLAAAADALGLLEVSPASATRIRKNDAVAAFVSRAETTFSRESRVSLAGLESEALEEASQALGRIASREFAETSAGAREAAATASLARGLVLFVARERKLSGKSTDSDSADADSADADADADNSPDVSAFAPTFEEAVARVAEAIAAFPPSADGAAFARAALERWSGESRA